jgi:hypothetical protein
MTKCVLVSDVGQEGIDAIIELAPTMKNLTREGKSYFRMDVWQSFPDGSIGALYLWTGYGPALSKRLGIDRDAAE